MAKISQIGDALNRINDAAFQELCNKFLYYKYDYKNINQKGSVIGKEKTKKGTPDTIFIDKNDSYIFAEYTTKEKIGNSKSFFQKIKSDVIACFDLKKAKIENEKVSKVISCHTEKLELSEIEELKQLCKSYNQNCIFEQYGIDDLCIQLELYPSLLSSYLDIHIGTGQIMQLPEYINYYEKPDLRISTTLSNKFYGREKEFETGLSFLSVTNLLLITGASGVGKTKFAIELCKKFIEENSTYSLLCFANNNIEAYDDLQTQLLRNKDYVLLVDDANRAMGNYNFILLLLRSERKGKIKIVSTVRDYAVDLIKDASNEYNYQTLSLQIVTKEEINTILKSEDFNIQNNDYLDEINSLARGNLRIAIMCATIAIKEQSLHALNDISDLYELYFNDIYKKIIALDKVNSLKVLGIISFFRTISKERKEFNEKIFSTFSISEDIFWEQCHKLNQNEIVDLYENEIVKISDQILSTYLFYKVFFYEKLLDFGWLIRSFIDNDSKFYDSLNPLINAFDQASIIRELISNIEPVWDELIKDGNHNQILKISKLFWFCLGNKLLSYLYNYIKQLPESEDKTFTVDYKHNDMSTSESCDILSILSHFKYFYDEKSVAAIELMFLYIEKKPAQSKKLSYLFKENWIITRLDYDILYPQNILIDFLIKKVKENLSIDLYTKFFFKISSNLLETTFRENASEGNQMTLYTINISLTDSVKLLRQKIWDFVWSLYPKEAESIYKLLFNLGGESHKDAKDIWASDYTMIGNKLKEIDYYNYKACEAVNRFLDRLTWAEIEYDKSIEEVVLTNKLFKLNKLLIDRDYSDSWEDNINKKRKEITEYCKNFKYQDYVSLFSNIETLKSLEKDNQNDYDFPLSTILSNIIERDKNLFVEVFIYYIENCSTHLWGNSLLISYFACEPTDYMYLFERLSTSKSDKAPLWLLNYHGAISKHYLDKSDNKLLLNFYEILTCLNFTICRISEIVEKYEIYESKKVICKKIINILRSTPHLTIDGNSLSYLLAETSDYVDCQTIYIKCKKNDSHFDYKQELFIQLLQKDVNFLIKYLDSTLKENVSISGYNTENFAIIWTLDSYDELIWLATDYFIKNQIRLYSRDFSIMFFSEIGKYNDRALAFIENVINNHYNDKNYIGFIFNVISHSYPQKRIQYLKQFLQLNQDFSSFENIDFFPRSMSTVGSWVPVYEKRKSDWEEILEAIKSLNYGIKLINHTNYIEEQINSCSARIKNEAKRDFLERFDS